MKKRKGAIATVVDKKGIPTLGVDQDVESMDIGCMTTEPAPAHRKGRGGPEQESNAPRRQRE